MTLLLLTTFILAFLVPVASYLIRRNRRIETFKHIPNKQDAVLITGGSSGIGFEMAKIFARDGWRHIIICSNDNEEKQQQCKKELESLNTNSKVILLHKDLSKEATPQEIFDEVTQQLMITVTCLVNNAGFAHVTKFVGSPVITMNKHADLLNVNLMAVVKLTHLFVSEMISKGIQGKVLNVSSIAGFGPQPGWINYAASKAFVSSFSIGLREELKEHNVTVTTLFPGVTKTPFLEKSGNTKTYMDFIPASPPEFVAKSGYYGLMNNEGVVIPGLLNHISWYTTPFCPQSWYMKFVSFIHSPKK